MFDDKQGFLTRAFLRREWDRDYTIFRDSEEETALLARLRAWAARADMGERSSETAFVQTFFVDTWGYHLSGQRAEAGYSAWPQFPVAGAGQGGAMGAADLALGYFGDRPDAIPQVLCEFKDIRSNLDAPQARKGNTRSPVKQCLDYVAGARRPLIGNEPVLPWWGLVTDMNEFRLYWWDRAPQSFLRFTIHDGLLPDLLKDDEEARFDRFLFATVFQREKLLSLAGRPNLLRLVERQGGREKALEGDFYADYKAVRERLFNVLMAENQQYKEAPGRLLRLSQKILDRFIFAFYAEDMGERMLFPPQLLKDHLKTQSRSHFYDPAGDDMWRTYKGLFQAIDQGGKFGQITLRAINGGLFRADPEIDELTLSNQVFCAVNQGVNDASIKAHPNTLLHLCASYDYAARGQASESISLYTLGRIFEQSITWLEIEEARLEGRKSLAEVGKRKIPSRRSQGVYYTPEWVVDRVVAGTMDPWFAAQKLAVGWTGDAPTDAAMLAAYEARVKAVRIVDPACGSGAFLIGAFRRMLRERLEIDGHRRALPGAIQVAADEAAMTAEILDANIHGVDISAPAVEIAKLALWLHSARADAPLSTLDGNIRCGNSLVGPGFWADRPIEDMTPAAEERVNAFDWVDKFDFPIDPGRFDIVLGNPPYVKLQTLKAVDPQVAAYLVDNRGDDYYASAQTGNFDLYLPFIEKGLRLLRPGGRMGYIAPSLWPVNEYGQGLRALIHAGRHLEGWIDFRSHQIFTEATTYTALQYFTADPAPAVAVAMAPAGETDVAAIDWTDPEHALDWDRLSDAAPWLMATGAEREFIDRLMEDCVRLDDPSVTTHIFQGLITSLDYVYHLERLAHGRYRCTPKDGEPTKGRPHSPPYEVAIEDAIMKPLISGEEAKRYQDPHTQTFLLFPYERDATGRMALISTQAMAQRYPQAWAHLSSWKTELCAREGNRFEGDAWHQFGRSQNIDKQENVKLLVPRLVIHLKSSLDAKGVAYLDNVDVGGVIATRPAVAAFLNGVLNGPVADFVFRRISKPFANDYLSANKQFIAPLPIPRATPLQVTEVARGARNLQRWHTRRRDLLASAQARLEALGRRPLRDEAWLWPGLPDLEALRDAAPARLRDRAARTAWAGEQRAEAITAACAALQVHLGRGGVLDTAFADGELTLTAGGARVLGVFLDDADGQLARAYWQWVLLTTPATDAVALSTELRKTPGDGDRPAARQFIARVADLAAATAAIAQGEADMNARLFDLYGLDQNEREMVAGG